jgi:RimJ/RimL family protein N-acetyltransferase
MDLKIDLRQVEMTDSSSLRDILGSKIKNILDLPVIPEISKIEEWVRIISLDPNQYYYAIIVRGSGADVYLVGLCGLDQIDWISRHARLRFLTIDKDNYSSSIQNHPHSRTALQKILKIGFEKFGLNKIRVEITELDKSLAVLEELGFVAEGVRRDAVFKQGKFLSVIVLSLLAAEFRGAN